MVAYGYVGSMWIGTQTWKTKENGANVTKRSGFHSESKRFKGSFVANEKPSSLLPMIYSPVIKNFLCETPEELIEYMYDELNNCESLKEVRSWYKKYAKYYHPDFLGRDLFPYEKITYNYLNDAKEKLVNFLKDLEEVFVV